MLDMYVCPDLSYMLPEGQMLPWTQQTTALPRALTEYIQHDSVLSWAPLIKCNDTPI